MFTPIPFVVSDSVCAANISIVMALGARCSYIQSETDKMYLLHNLEQSDRIDC